MTSDNFLIPAEISLKLCVLIMVMGSSISLDFSLIYSIKIMGGFCSFLKRLLVVMSF